MVGVDVPHALLWPPAGVGLSFAHLQPPNYSPPTAPAAIKFSTSERRYITRREPIFMNGNGYLRVHRHTVSVAGLTPSMVAVASGLMSSPLPVKRALSLNSCFIVILRKLNKKKPGTADGFLLSVGTGLSGPSRWMGVNQNPIRCYNLTSKALRVQGSF